MFSRGGQSCLVLRTQTAETRLRDLSYSCHTVAGSRLLNSLPADLRSADTELAEFKRLSKTHLFRADETPSRLLCRV